MRLLFLFLFPLSLSSQSWLSLDSLSADTDLMIGSFEVAPSGNYYVSGFAHHNAWLGNHQFTNAQQHYTDFVAKLDSNLNVVWVNEMPTIYQHPGAITLDSNENVYYIFPIDASCTIGSTFVDYTRGENVLIRIDKSGQIKNLYNFGDRYIGGVGGYNSCSYGLSVRDMNFLSVSFSYVDTAYLATDTLIAPYPYGVERFAILNFDSSLNEISHYKIPLFVSYIKYDRKGNLFVTGQFSTTSAVMWGPVSLPHSCMLGGIIAKMGQNGLPFWAKYINSVGMCYDGQIAFTSNLGEMGLDKDNNVYTTGFYMSNSTYSGTSLSYGSPFDFCTNLITTKIDSGGNVLWYKTSTATSSNFGWSIAVDSCGDAVVSGGFSGTFNSGAYSVTQQYPSYQSRCLLLISYDALGNTTGILSGETHFENNTFVRFVPNHPGKAQLLGTCDWYTPYFGSLSLPSADWYQMAFSASAQMPVLSSCSSLGIPTQNAQVQLHLLPNPADEDIYFTIASQNSGTFSVFTSEGRALKEGVVIKGMGTIKVTDFSSGFYLFKFVDSNGKQYSSKFTVIH